MRSPTVFLAPGVLLLAMTCVLLCRPSRRSGPATFSFRDPRPLRSSGPVLVVEPVGPPPDSAERPPARRGTVPAALASDSAVKIPGVEAADVLLALRRAGLTCAEAATSPLGITWTCSADASRTTYSVLVQGSGAESLRTITADVTERTPRPDVPAALFLSSLASLQYIDSDPERARRWVAENIHRAASMSVGPVRFELSGPARARSLAITAEPGP